MNFNEYYFTEALSNDLMNLQRYLQMSSEDKALYRAMSTPYLIHDYLSAEGKENKRFKKMEDYEIVEWLSEKDPETAIDYGEYLVGQREYYDNSEPQLYDVVELISFVRQKWLVHFSDSAHQIKKDQNFKIGIPYEDYSRLALTTHFKNTAKTGGFNFGYEVEDVDRYAFDKRGGGIPKYGKEAVLFKGDGIKVYHSGDEEPQVIFDGKQTYKPIIHVENDGDKWYITSSLTGEKIIEREKLTDIAKWIDLNYNQYRKHLEPKK